MNNEITKVVCINNEWMNLKLNKVYDAVYIHEQRSWDWNNVPILEWHWYELINEKNEKKKYETKHFITLAEWREQQMKAVLDD